MINVTLTELTTNISFEAKSDRLPGTTTSYNVMYVDEKEVKTPAITQSNGSMKVKLTNPDSTVENFLARWQQTKKRISVMFEAPQKVYLLKGCYIKDYTNPDKAFSLVYNTYKES